MHKLVVAVTLAALPQIVAADSLPRETSAQADRFANVTFVGGAQRSVQTGIDLDAGQRIGDSPLFARGAVSIGTSGPDGFYQQVRLGGEARHCDDVHAVCVLAGADLGYQHDHARGNTFLFSDTLGMVETEAHDALLVPRIAVESGGTDGFRMRLLVEVPLRVRLDALDGNDARAGAGLRIGLGGGYAF